MKKAIAAVMLIMSSGVVFADEIAVTVYNSNLGVVSEKRSLEFSKGDNQLAFRDVPALIDAASVRFEVSGQGNINILEQNYAYDLVSPEQIYSKYIDNDIQLVDKSGQLYEGTLLAYSSGSVTVREKSGRIKIVLLANISEVNFPSLPEGLITRPTLFWKYNSDIEGRREGQVSYQTAGMTWEAEYVGVLSAEETNLGLSGWASINNTSGKTYADASLKLIAGDIHRAQRPSPPGRMDKFEVSSAREFAGFEEKAFFEYHLYTLPRQATIANNEIKQISLFEPASTGVAKSFLFRPETNPTKVEVLLKFKNSQQAGLGIPLPAGRVRTFKADIDGSMILLGEDYVGHTPKDEEIKLNIGYAFDITAEEKLLEQVRVSREVEEQLFEIKLNNRKNQPVVIDVEKKLYGFWEIVETSLEYTKKDANTVLFKPQLNPESSTTITFKVRFTNR